MNAADRKREYARAWWAAHPEKKREYRKCQRENRLAGFRRHYAKNPERHITRVTRRMRERLYGVTQEKFDSMLKEQGGVCRICRKDSNGGRAWNVDHDHNTGTVRGLLCTNCNIGLGQFQENVETLANAIKYIQETKK